MNEIKEKRERLRMEEIKLKITNGKNPFLHKVSTVRSWRDDKCYRFVETPLNSAALFPR